MRAWIAQLVLLGRWSDDEDSLRESLGEIPDNAIAVDFAPELALDRAALLITHAGVNTVLESLSRAVAHGRLATQRGSAGHGVANRLRRRGIAGVLSAGFSARRDIQELVQRVLTEDSFKRRAAELQQAMIAAGGVSRAANIAERPLPRVARQTPVTRQSAGGSHQTIAYRAGMASTFRRSVNNPGVCPRNTRYGSQTNVGCRR